MSAIVYNFPIMVMGIDDWADSFTLMRSYLTLNLMA